MLSASDLRRLDRLAIASSAMAATAAGQAHRHVNVRGHGLEFHDFRAYQPGDHPRAIDWNVHARLRQLVVRVARADAHVHVHLLVDSSASMTIGSPSKLAAASALAGALAYVAIRQRDTVGLATFDDSVHVVAAPANGRRQLLRVMEGLRRLEGHGASNINAALLRYGGVVHGPGLAIVLSDFLHPEGSLDGVRYLLHRGIQPALVQVLADDEIAPVIAGDIELADVEDALATPIIVDAAAVTRYRRELEKLSATLAGFCRREGLPYLQLRSTAPLGEALTACQRSHLLVSRS